MHRFTLKFSLPQAAELADRPEQHPLIARQGESASSYARLFAVLERAHEHLRTGRTVTLRDLYYRLKTSELFKSPSDVSKAVSQAAAMLGVPRSALGIACGSKGAFAGSAALCSQTTMKLSAWHNQASWHWLADVPSQ